MSRLALIVYLASVAVWYGTALIVGLYIINVYVPTLASCVALVMDLASAILFIALCDQWLIWLHRHLPQRRRS